MTDATYKVQEEDLIRSDIDEYLRRHETKDMLRLLTCGSVDDGKSTLIGRLLYDSHMIYEDQLEKITKDSKIYGTTDDNFDPALLTDGLKAEREQGITIDVAYRYFSTDKRKFIIADCPGHEQYTRNMATGASTCNLAIILIDARYGVIQQTKRHSFICSLLGIKHVLVAVNKMDLVDYSESVYEEIRAQYSEFISRLDFSDVHYIPISALLGDNVVTPSESTPWYNGPTLLHHLEGVNISTDLNLVDARLPVQSVQRPHLDFRGFAGTIASGVFRKGDRVIALPGRQESNIASIIGPDGELDEASASMAVTVTLDDEIDVSRGMMLSAVNNQPHVDHEFEAMVVWMHEDAMRVGGRYDVKLATATAPAQISGLRYVVDVNTMHRLKGETPAEQLELNEIGRCHITLHRSVAFDPYQRNRSTGGFILIDRITNATVGAGMILDRVVSASSNPEPVSQNITQSTSLVSNDDRQKLLGQRGTTIWLTGLSGSGKSTVAQELERRLVDQGHACIVLDGDNVRHGLNRDLGFSADDRQENIRRISEVAKLFNDAGMIVITAFISPYRADRDAAREIVGDGFVEVFVNTPLEICEQRDPKGLYAKARTGEIAQFTGISAPYEAPAAAELTLDTENHTPEELVTSICDALTERNCFLR